MPVPFWICYAVFSAALFLLAARAFGLPLAFALWISVLVHEAGHYAWLKLCGIRAIVFVSPYLGLCAPVEDDPSVALTPVSKGCLYLAGCFGSLLWAFFVYLLLASPAGSLLPGSREFWSGIRLIPLFMNLLNLLVLLPVTDGGRCLLLIFSGESLCRARMLASLGLLQGIYAFSLLDVTSCAIFGGISLILLPLIYRHGISKCWQFRAGEKLALLAGWLFIVGGSVALLMTHSYTRWRLQEFFGEYVGKCSTTFLYGTNYE